MCGIKKQNKLTTTKNKEIFPYLSKDKKFLPTPTELNIHTCKYFSGSMNLTDLTQHEFIEGLKGAKDNARNWVGID